MGKVQIPIGERIPEKALGSGHARRSSRTQCVHSRNPGVTFIVTLISERHRKVDPGNLEGGFKHLQDAVAKWIGIDDGDSRIRFEYHQLLTEGEQGTIVKIEATLHDG